MPQSIEMALGAGMGKRRCRSRRRNKGFDETHRALIETAMRLVSAKGMDALSLAEVAREAGVNRTTVYYHFAHREALVDAIREWSRQQFGTVMAPSDTAENRTRGIIRYVLENPEVVALWTEDFLAPGSIADRYVTFDGLVDDLAVHFAAEPEAEGMEAEVFATFMLTWSMIGPRIYRNSVRPEIAIDDMVERLTGTHMAMLRRCGLVRV